MKDTMEANLKDKAIENIIDPKNPEIALFSLNCLYVFGRGLFIIVMVTGFALR
jgi:hypothetical protein